jgi:hypothetical protein
VLAPLFGEGLGAAKLRVVVVGEAVVSPSGELEAGADGALGSAGTPGSIDALLALSTGTKRRRRRSSPNPIPAAQPARTQTWQLIAPQTLRAERRDVHRRTRRAKPRRRPVVLAQSQLFGNGDS